MDLLLNIDVPDIEKAARFYMDAFGLTVARHFGKEAAELVGWPVRLYLLRKRESTHGAGADPRRYGRHWTPIHPDIVVDNIDAACARAVAAGAVLEQPPKDEPYGRIAMLADPFGHGLCLIEFNDKGYDALL